MRASCLSCARKHLAAAEVLMCEALLGYPIFSWYAVGHLEQAEEELLSDYPNEAAAVRAERVNYADSLEFEIKNDTIRLVSAYKIDTHSILLTLTFLECEEVSAGDHGGPEEEMRQNPTSGPPSE